ncbi:MAG TPA: threonine synthase, partial [Roseococcus sp.]|nr:threonine synthase [Roseococcus sp.]
VPDAAWRAAAAQFSGFALDDDGTLAEIRRLHEECGYLADPHTAIGTAAARALAPADPGMPVIIAATAHPAKFPDAVEQATGLRPPLPPALADLFEREERFSTLPNELRGAQDFVRAHARRN